MKINYWFFLWLIMVVAWGFTFIAYKNVDNISSNVFENLVQCEKSKHKYFIDLKITEEKLRETKDKYMETGNLLDECMERGNKVYN